MIEVATARINSFAHAAQQVDAQPSEESIFVLTAAKLQDIITQAVQEALEGHESLYQTVQGQAREIGALNAKLETMQKDMDCLAENQFIQLKLIDALRGIKTATEVTKNRQDILHALLAANNGKMLARDARKKMRVPKSSFCELLKTCYFVEKRPYHLDPRQDVLLLK